MNDLSFSTCVESQVKNIEKRVKICRENHKCIRLVSVDLGLI
jgi:hypothetical protein